MEESRIRLFELTIQGNGNYNDTSVQKGLYRVWAIPSQKYDGRRKDSRCLERIEVEKHQLLPKKKTKITQIFELSDERSIGIALRQGLPNLILYNLKRRLGENIYF